MPWSHPSIYRVRVYIAEPSQSGHSRPLQHQVLRFPSLFSLAIPDVLTVSQTRPYLPSFMPMRLLLPLPKTRPSPWLPGNPHSEVRTQHTHKSILFDPTPNRTRGRLLWATLRSCAFPITLLRHVTPPSLFLSIVLFSIGHALWLLFTLSLPCQNIRLVMLVCCVYCDWIVPGTQ